MTRRPRRRARDIAPASGRNHVLFLILIGVGLAFVLFFRASMSDTSSQLFQAVVGNPELELPKSVTDQTARETVQSKESLDSSVDTSADDFTDGGD